jgi:RNA-directed DNA polymerase
MLRGWAQYHSPVVAKETFSRVDCLLFWRLMRWAKRRHPKKSINWIRRKYWRTVDNRNWVFAADMLIKQGEKGIIELYPLAGTSIRRHKKLKGDYHPYDPQWEMYGETIRQERMQDKMRYRREWAGLYIQQGGLCAHCGGEINEDTGWHDHHIIQRVMGGLNTLSNRVLLHPNCHAQVHNLGLTVVKPAPV